MIEQMKGYYNGMPVIATNLITKRVPARPHRKGRIHKKWLKRYGYKDVPDNNKFLIMNGCIYMTPRAVTKISKWMKEADNGKP